MYVPSLMYVLTLRVHWFNGDVWWAKDGAIVIPQSHGVPRHVFPSIVVFHFVSRATQAAGQVVTCVWPVRRRLQLRLERPRFSVPRHTRAGVVLVWAWDIVLYKT